jgi:hypothetical protein
MTNENPDYPYSRKVVDIEVVIHQNIEVKSLIKEGYEITDFRLSNQKSNI